MAHDKSEPKSGIIFFFAILSVVTLVALQFVFSSYFTSRTETEVSEKILTAEPSEWKKMKSEQTDALEKGSMPIQQAMKLIARQKGTSQNPGIESTTTPSAEPNWAPVEGWTVEGQIHGEFSGPSEMARMKTADQAIKQEEDSERQVEESAGEEAEAP